jgi:phosphoglycerol transferase MdoB-like AlkP superfamily enzyme
MKRYQALHPFRALSEILGERGYYNAFAYGGDLAFDNVEGFFTQKGYDAFFGEEYFGRENGFSKWGVPDHVLFERTAALVDSLPRPFQLTILTVSNHEPFDLPDSSLQRYTDASDSARLFNCQIYADHALGRFMTLMRSSPVFDSTVFVFTADHARFGSGGFRGDPKDFHVPLLIYSPGAVGTVARRVKTYGSQVDIIPTLMGVFGGSYIHASWGRNLLQVPEGDPGFAPMSVFDQIASIDHDYYYFEVLGRSTALCESAEASNVEAADVGNERPDDFIRRQHRLRIYLQVGEQLCTPPQPGDAEPISVEGRVVTTETESDN